ncbi:MAG TPA: hypothetical protein VN228_15445 [Pyrinomonadaceae bacterium]|nr:hypothetical protein [Pyrinomonadaceae bacterium]
MRRTGGRNAGGGSQKAGGRARVGRAATSLSTFSLCLLLSAFCLPPPAPAAAREGWAGQDAKSQVIVPMRSGAFVVFTTDIVPAGASEVAAGFIESEESPNHIHRVFVDRKSDLFFGYELSVEPVAASRQFRVSVRPLSAAYEQQLRARPDFRGRRLHPSYNPSAFPARPQLVGDGDTFALDVLRNPRTGTKIVDVVTVSFDDPRLQEAPESARPPRDFRLEDVQMKVTGYRLLVDGEQVARSTSGCSGPLVWFSLTGRGRFIFSLVPRPGYDFRKVGTVSHNKIDFAWEGTRFEWVSSLPVVVGGGNWHLWVLRDPDYSYDLFERDPAAEGKESSSVGQAASRMRERGARAELVEPSETPRPAPPRRARVAIGAADRVESLLPKK